MDILTEINKFINRIIKGIDNSILGNRILHYKKTQNSLYNAYKIIFWSIIIFIVLFSVIILLSNHLHVDSKGNHYIPWRLIFEMLSVSIVAFITYLGIVFTDYKNNKRHEEEMEKEKEKHEKELNNLKEINEKMLLMLSPYSNKEKALIQLIEILDSFLDLLSSYKSDYDFYNKGTHSEEKLIYNNRLYKKEYSILNKEIENFEKSFLYGFLDEVNEKIPDNLEKINKYYVDNFLLKKDQDSITPEILCKPSTDLEELYSQAQEELKKLDKT
ncbi:MAG: hypothetical protein KO202_06010 [Methanobacteriaceae archaeon]|jgi:hypothetical protein|nr:hypothetical protein [Methanobacteriaceae archaeon]